MMRSLFAVFIWLTILFSLQIRADDGPIYRWQLDREHFDGHQVKALFGSVTLVGAAEPQFNVVSPGAAVFRKDGNSMPFLEAQADFSELELPAEALTAEAWVKIDQPLEWGGVFGAIQDNGDYERGWLLGYRKSQFFFAVASQKNKRITYLTCPERFELQQWYHIAGTWDGVTQSLYIDGKLVATSKAQSGAIVYPKQAHLGVGGYWDDDEHHPMTGEIEQVSLWDRALTEDEIEERFDSRKARFPGIEPLHPKVVDWPTHLRDNQRTGLANDVKLRFPLHLQWVHRTRHKPTPAWPPPARQDFWNKKHRLKARVTFDRACPLIAVGEAVYYASSADDQVVCLDRTSGRRRWRVFAEAPVRLAPTYDDGRILFGSDDGCVYCVDASDGSLHWKYRVQETDRQIVGNGRVISVWPVRSGVLVEEGKAYFSAGLFPRQGISHAAVDIETGKLIGRSALDASGQGYMEQRGSSLYVATGRDPAGAFVASLNRRGKGVTKEVRSIPDQYPFAFIGDSQSRFGGGRDEVAAFDVASGEKIWEANVDGHAYSMAISQSSLLVSTDQGLIYCFAESNNTLSEPNLYESEEYAWASDADRVKHLQFATRAIDAAGTRRGWALILNPPDAAIATAISERSEFKIICMQPDAGSVAATRVQLERTGLSGRVTVHQGDPSQSLPYTNYLFNLVIDAGAIGENQGGQQPSAAEMKRVTRPNGGVAILGPAPGDLFRRGPLEGIGEWTHQYADAGNTVCSGDQRVRGDMRLQWFGAPGPRGMMDRHHRTAAPLFSSGRLFVPGNNRLHVVDAYNGTPIWSVDIPNSRRAGVYRDCSYLATSGDSLYVSAAAECLHLDAATGRCRNTFQLTHREDHDAREWGFVATVDDLLFGSEQKQGASRRDHSRDQIEEGTYFDARPLVCSDALFAMNRSTGDVAWSYDSKFGPIVNSTIAIADRSVYFIESSNESLRSVSSGRHAAAELFSIPAKLTSLDMRTGDLRWRRSVDLKLIEHAIYLSAARHRVVVNGSYNKTADEESHVHVDVAVFDAESGERLWSKTQTAGDKAGGSHGEQELHPVIVGDHLYCEPFAYDLQTGDALENWKWNPKHRRGCGTISASASTFFFRHSNPTMFDLQANRYSSVTTCTRPGCWINMIPAGGLLLIPEGSSGCSCDYAIQTSMAFLPVPEK